MLSTFRFRRAFGYDNAGDNNVNNYGEESHEVVTGQEAFDAETEPKSSGIRKSLSRFSFLLSQSEWNVIRFNKF